MGKKAPSPPPVPDPAIAARAQGTANLDTAIAQAFLGNSNQFSPFGNVTFERTGSETVGSGDDARQVPRFTQTVTLPAAQQRQLDLQNALQEQALGIGGGVLNNVDAATSSPFSLEGLPQAPGIDDFSADRLRVEQAIIDRNQPQADRQRAALENTLANQGFVRGSEGFDTALDELNRAQNDFNLAAIAQGGAEQSRLFGLGQAARQQGLEERSFERSQPINEFATLLGLGGNVQGSQFTPFQAGQIAPTDVIGAVNAANAVRSQNFATQSQAATANRGATLGLVGTLAGAAATAF